jgi:hypothetical protein
MTVRAEIEEIVLEILNEADLIENAKDRTQVATKVASRLIMSHDLLILRTYDRSQVTKINLSRAEIIVDKIARLRAIRTSIKQAYAGDELSGGMQAALENPLYIEAGEHIQELNEDLKELSFS